jgi:hypothetical protein
MSTQESEFTRSTPPFPELPDEQEFARKFREVDDETVARTIKERQPEYRSVSDADLVKHIKSLDDGALTRGLLKAFPEYQSRVKLSDSALRPAVTSSVNEAADFDAPLHAEMPDAKPVEFQPFTASDLPFAARMAAGGARLAGASMQEVPESSPLRGGKLVKATVKTAGNHSYPNADEMADALLDALGAGDVGRRYRAETGHNIITPDIGLEELKRGYDPQSKSYSFEVQPTNADIRVVNAYAKGGVEAAEAEIAKMRGEVSESDARQAQGDEAARKAIEGLGYKPEDLSAGNGAVAKGIGDAVIGTSRLMNNVAGFVRDPQDSARDAEFIEGAQQAIPAEQTGVGRVVRGVTGVVASAPRYANPAAPVVAALENLHRGEGEAIKAGMTMAVPAGVAHGAGEALQGLNPVARQVAARNLAGVSSVVSDRVSGSDRSAVESYVEGALLPTGGKGHPEGEPEFASNRQFVEKPAAQYRHPTFGLLTEVESQRGVPRGRVRVVDEAGSFHVIQKPNGRGRENIQAIPEKERAGVLSEVNAAVNLPRGFQASFDDSATLRQNLILGVLHPGRGLEAFGNSIKALRSEEKANAILDDIHSNPELVQKRKDAGLYLASENRDEGTKFLDREEAYGSKFARLIPGVSHSERAFTVAVDSLRSNVFDDFAAAHPNAEPETLRDVARFIGYASGRGSLTGRRGIDSTLAQVFYSPRLAVSRPQLLTTPFRGTPEGKAYARAELTKYFAATAGFLGLAKLAGASVAVNPTDPDFAKIRLGNMRIDLGAGYAQLFRYLAQGISGRGRSLKTGGEYEAGRGAVVERFIRTKLSPQASIVVNTALGEDLRGQKTSLGQEAKKLLVPLSFGDVYDAWQDSGAGGAALSSLSLLGAGVQTIKPPTDEELLTEQFEKLKVKPENKGLTRGQLMNNARVRHAIAPLLRQIDESDRSDVEKEQLKHDLNTYLYPAAARPGERRQLEAIERVATERLGRAEGFLKKKMEALKQAKPKAVSLNESDWQQFPEGSGSLDIPRASMPQVKSEHRGAMVQFLRGRGISHSAERVAPNTLKPSQAEFSPEKVEKARSFDGPQRPVLVSSDNYVADGHHQWLSDLRDAPEKPIKIIRLDSPIRSLLLEMARFPSSGVDEAMMKSQGKGTESDG